MSDLFCSDSARMWVGGWGGAVGYVWFHNNIHPSVPLYQGFNFTGVSTILSCHSWTPWDEHAQKVIVLKPSCFGRQHSPR